MPLTEQRKESIRDAVAAGRRVNRQATGRVTLPMGRSRYEVLATSAGLTVAGHITAHSQGQLVDSMGWVETTLYELEILSFCTPEVVRSSA